MVIINKSFIFLCFLFIGCTYLKEESCKDSMDYYKGIGFNIVLLDKPVRNMDFYDVKARDLVSNRDTLIRIDRMFASFTQLWTPGDTVKKELGTTSVELCLQDSIFGTNKFISIWTCEDGLTINGYAPEVWRGRLNAAGYP